MRPFVTVEGAAVLAAAVLTAALTKRPELLVAGALVLAFFALERAWLTAPATLEATSREGLSERGARLVDAVETAARAVVAELGATPAPGLVESTVERVAALTSRDARLIRQLEAIERKLAAADPCKLAAERDRLRAIGGDASYARAADMIDATLADHAELVCTAKRLEAEHAAIEAALEAARGRIVRARLAPGSEGVRELEETLTRLGATGEDR